MGEHVTLNGVETYYERRGHGRTPDTDAPFSYDTMAGEGSRHIFPGHGRLGSWLCSPRGPCRQLAGATPVASRFGHRKVR